MTTTAVPTDDELAAARDTLARAAVAKAEGLQAAYLALVTMPEYGAVIDAARTVQAQNPGDVEVGYIVSMMERVRSSHAPR
ncbi:hypothetical protein [Sphingomonas leidyi]|uniref:hypothetical protein n=1 Tax=Sphingomonas leidyi TaxID=68569 RepID=UPI0036D3F55D